MDCLEMKKDVALIFDFDGTMCALFKNYNLENTKQLLKQKLQKYDIDFSLEKDAFEVFDEIISQTECEQVKRIDAFIEANKILSEAEQQAVITGELIDGVEEIIPMLINKGYKVGISTNNSEKCVKDFLVRIHCELDIPVVGRVGKCPELMKPNPWSVLEVCKRMNLHMEKVVFIGDNLRDFLCAQAAKCDFIGVATSEKKRLKLCECIDESNVVTNFYELSNKIMEF